MEKETYRDTLAHLSSQGYEMLILKKEACELLGICYSSLRGLIKKGELRVVKGRVSLASIARLLC